MKSKASKKQKKMKGGFVPTVMEGFSFYAAKYITPMALFAAYKMYTKKKTSKK
jgi:hypothetical protein